MVDFDKMGNNHIDKEREAKIQAMSDLDFAKELERMMIHCTPPEPGPTYDWSMHWLYLPEAIKRLKK